MVGITLACKFHVDYDAEPREYSYGTAPRRDFPRAYCQRVTPLSLDSRRPFSYYKQASGHKTFCVSAKNHSRLESRLLARGAGFHHLCKRPLSYVRDVKYWTNRTGQSNDHSKRRTS